MKIQEDTGRSRKIPVRSRVDFEQWDARTGKLIKACIWDPENKEMITVTLPPDSIGDKHGHRYEIRAKDEGGVEFVVGWSADPEAFTRAIELHPCWHDRRVIDREAVTNLREDIADANDRKTEEHDATRASEE